MAVLKNTLESILAEILRREKNSLEIISRLEEIFRSSNDSIILEYTLEDGTTDELEFQSHGFILQELRRINNSIESITGLDELSSANIKLPDGSVKTIISSEVPVEPKTVLSVGKPLFFHKKNNKPADKFLNPLPFIRFDLTDKINVDTEQVMVKKVILDLNNPQDLDFFNTQIDGIPITLSDLKDALQENGITSVEFDEVVPLPPKSPKFSGSFDVINTFKRNVTTIVDGAEFTEKRIIYKLNTILYSDLEDEETDVALKVGDELLVNAELRDTKYRIDTIDTSNNEITVKKVQGFRSITKGLGKLVINPGFINQINIEVGVNINEYMVVFFKPLNPNLNIMSTNWGEGTGLFTNNLVDFDDQVNNITLSQFYDDFIEDSGKNLQSLAKENFIPLQDAIEPDPPTLNTDDFRVVKINSHREDVQSTESLRRKFSEKNKTKKDIDKLDAAIEKQKNLIAVGDFKTEKERRNAENTLDDLFSQRSTKVNQYNTLIDDIIARTKELTNFSPKYRVRGFFEIPQPKFLDEDKQIGKQDVVQFEIQYRYLRTDNTSTEADGFEFTQTTPVPTGLGEAANGDTPVTTEGKKATFSRWVRVESKRRKKNVETEEKVIPTDEDENAVTTVSTIVLEEEDTNDPETVNINQVDIPISPNENVEIRVRSISEAGYPNMLSEFSESVVVEFPEELIDEVEFIGEEAMEEQLRARFLQELNAIGLNQHLSDSIEVGGDTFAHSAINIATTFKTPENKPIDVNQKLIDQQAEIDALRAIITAEIAEMSISITDEEGNEIQAVSNNDTVNIFAGFYKDEVSGASVPKGEVVTKLYFIKISNVSDVVLELLSYVPGVVDEIAPIGDSSDPDFVNAYEGFLINKNEYDGFRKYWRVPLSLRSITEGDEFEAHHEKHQGDNPFIQIPSFQSGQVKGQLLYSRRTDVSLNNKLYDGLNDSPTDQTFVPTQSGGVAPQTFIWDESETITTPNGGGFETEFCVHIDHPDLASGSDLMNDFSNLFDASNKVPDKTINAGKVNYPFFTHSKFFNLQSTEQNGQLQLDYIHYTPNITGGANIENFPKKIGFTKNDKYLIGKNTCGSYLFLAPATHTAIHTGSQIFNVGKQVKTGEDNALRIPFIFQCRMTDYYGSGSGGSGVLGGFGSPANLTNLVYAKKIGIDVQVKDQALFSFDIKVEMQFKAASVSDVEQRGGAFQQTFEQS